MSDPSGSAARSAALRAQAPLEAQFDAVEHDVPSRMTEPEGETREP